MKIYKYPIRPNIKTYELPKNARILSVGVQNGEIMIWVLVDPDAERENRIIEIFPTGFVDIDNATRNFIGTVFIGDFVFHVFERLEEQN